MSSLLNNKDVEERKLEPFVMILEKYKQPVVINSVKVDEDDDTLLVVDFDHDIDNVPADDISEELGKVLIQKIQEGMTLLDVEGGAIGLTAETVHPTEDK